MKLAPGVEFFLSFNAFLALLWRKCVVGLVIVQTCFFSKNRVYVYFLIDFSSLKFNAMCFITADLCILVSEDFCFLNVF